MPRYRVMGLDISANRIAWAITDSVRVFTWGRYVRGHRHLDTFVMIALDTLRAVMREHDVTAICLEINLHPKLIHKGHIAPNMVRAYMRSRWVEGAILYGLDLGEPTELNRNKKGLIPVVANERCYALAATWTKKAKETRRGRMSLLYASDPSWRMAIQCLSEDEVDALAIGHDCAAALTAGILRKREDRKA